MDRYAEVFDVRGHKYDAAMRAFPTARDEEFRQLLQGLDVAPLKTVVDLPSGGGYLHRFLDPYAELTEFDPSTDFGSESALAVHLEDLQLPTGSADLVVSLAALHHVRFLDVGAADIASWWLAVCGRCRFRVGYCAVP